MDVFIFLSYLLILYFSISYLQVFLLSLNVFQVEIHLRVTFRELIEYSKTLSARITKFIL